MQYNIYFKGVPAKLVKHNTLINSALLLQVFETTFQDLTQEFVDYDTSGANTELPKTGKCLCLLFCAHGHLFTTVRKDNTANRELYQNAQGRVFDIICEK